MHEFGEFIDVNLPLNLNKITYFGGYMVGLFIPRYLVLRLAIVMDIEMVDLCFLQNFRFRLQENFYGGVFQYNSDLQIVVVSAMIEITVSYLIVAFCIYGIIAYLRKNQSQFTHGRLKIQKQVTKALLGQVSIQMGREDSVDSHQM